jgi:hypothetical protein
MHDVDVIETRSYQNRAGRVTNAFQEMPHTTTLVTVVANQEAYASCITNLAALEVALLREPLRSWEKLLNLDSLSTFCQGPVWTLHWYRAYRESFDPLVLFIERRGALLGVVPLAVEKNTRRLVFAGDQMADYRDVVALPEYRENVIRELLRVYRAGDHPNVLRLGPTRPESPTADVVLSICGSTGVRAIRRSHYGWRWCPEEATQVDDPLKKKSVRYPLNYFRRRGDVTAEVIDRREVWDHFKDEYYNQHSLRQLYGGRKSSFDDPRKRAFFDSLFDTSLAHVTVLKVAGTAIAGHFGCLWNDVLYWGAPSFDVREQAYSPGLLLVVQTMKRADEWGIKAFDLTIGGGDLKERFSTSRVDLPTAEVYARAWPYYRRRLVDVVIRGVRRPLEKLCGESVWDKKVRPFLLELFAPLHAAWRLGVVCGLSYSAFLGRSIFSVAGEKTTWLIFTATPDDVDKHNDVTPADGYNVHKNEIYDLLKSTVPSPLTVRQLTAAARKLPDAVRSGKDFHTVLVGKQIAAWGFSSVPKGPIEGAIPSFEVEADSVLLQNFETISELRNSPALQLLLADVLKQRFSEGVARACLVMRNADAATREAVRRSGFRLCRTTAITRLFRWEWTRTWTE